MELRELRYFLAVAREENISKAAEYLYITQPSLSRQMQNLEEELGQKLFVRGNRKITLTEAGMLLRKRAEEIIELYERTESELMSPTDIISGDIYIGSGESYAIKIIAEVAKEFQMEYPDVKFHFYSGDTNDVSEKLDKGLIDFGILVEPSYLTKYDYLRLPLTDTWGVLMRQDSELAKKETIKPADLFDAPIIKPRHILATEGLSKWLNQDLSKIKLVATYNLIYNASLMVEEGMGYAITLDKLINTSGNSNLCFRPLEPLMISHLDVCWKKYQMFSKASLLFITRLQEKIKTFG